LNGVNRNAYSILVGELLESVHLDNWEDDGLSVNRMFRKMWTG